MENIGGYVFLGGTICIKSCGLLVVGLISYKCGQQAMSKVLVMLQPRGSVLQVLQVLYAGHKTAIEMNWIVGRYQ